MKTKKQSSACIMIFSKFLLYQAKLQNWGRHKAVIKTYTRYSLIDDEEKNKVLEVFNKGSSIFLKGVLRKMFVKPCI